jgi:hypothetical protein
VVEMEIFSPQDIVSGLGAVLQLLFETGLGWILLLGIGVTIVADILAPRRSRTSGKKPRTRRQSASRDLSAALAAGTVVWAALLTDFRASASHDWFWVLTLLVVGGWAAVGAFTYRRRKQANLQELARMDLDDMIHMTPDEFEELVADLFRARGYWAQVVGGMGDHGVDIEVRSHDGVRAIVQCKRYAHDHWVGEREVRDLFGAFTHDGRAAKAYLVTTSTFSNAARRWAEGKPIKLMEGERLAEAMHEITASKGQRRV